MYKNFISKIFHKDLSVLKSEDNVRARLENVAWPSECSADLGPYTVGECQRALFYKIIGAQPTDDMTVRGAYICDAGLMYEKYHIERFKSMDMLRDQQTRIEFQTETKNKVIIAGKMDCIIEDANSKKGIEIKSVSAFKAPDIFGYNGKMPLPQAHNLMQAMLYKHWTKNTEEGKAADIDEVYLMYVNRSDGSTFYYAVDLDDKGYPILTAIDQAGREIYKMNLQEAKSYTELANSSGIATTDQGRMAELRISTKDIFDKFDRVYTCAKKKILPSADFSMNYTPDGLEKAHKCGRITKRKLTMLKKSGEPYSDYRCGICSYMKKCLSDSGVNLITF